MISLFYSSSILLLRDRWLPVASQDCPQDLLLCSSYYQPLWPPLFIRHAVLGIPIKPSTPITGVHILFKTAHLTKPGFTQSITRLVCTAVSRPAWEEKAFSSYSASFFHFLVRVASDQLLSFGNSTFLEDQTILHVRLCQD